AGHDRGAVLRGRLRSCRAVGAYAGEGRPVAEVESRGRLRRVAAREAPHADRAALAAPRRRAGAIERSARTHLVAPRPLTRACAGIARGAGIRIGSHVRQAPVAARARRVALHSAIRVSAHATIGGRGAGCTAVAAGVAAASGRVGLVVVGLIEGCVGMGRRLASEEQSKASYHYGVFHWYINSTDPARLGLSEISHNREVMHR